MTVRYPDLIDYLSVAVEVTALDVDALSRVTNLDLADSALHAPAAGWGGEDFYPDFIDKAAVLLVRLAKNHPLPDGNKRAAWVTLRLFIRDERVVLEGIPLGRGGRGRRGRRCCGRVGRGQRRDLVGVPLAPEPVAPAVSPCCDDRWSSGRAGRGDRKAAALSTARSRRGGVHRSLEDRPADG